MKDAAVFLQVLMLKKSARARSTPVDTRKLLLQLSLPARQREKWSTAVIGFSGRAIG